MPPAPRPHRRSSPGDSERVGTGPNGEALYAAEWVREPTHQELSFYLPKRMPEGGGWGLVACRTAARNRVEDCVELGNSPPGSRLASAVRQAAWQFLVRPPRVGGRPQVGEWVRIRIDYSVDSWRSANRSPASVRKWRDFPTIGGKAAAGVQPDRASSGIGAVFHFWHGSCFTLGQRGQRSYSMQNVQQRQSLFSRDDTFLGICEGIGQDFGFHPNLLRVTLACLCFFYPVPVLATYFGLGVLVFATRWMAPNVVEFVEREASRTRRGRICRGRWAAPASARRLSAQKSEKVPKTSRFEPFLNLPHQKVKRA